MHQIEVRDAEEESRYAIEVDGEVAGFIAYRTRDNQTYLFLHTEVDREFSGRGVGRTLVSEALGDLRRHGANLVPICPFVWRFIQENPEYEDLINHEIFDRISASVHG